jgi:EVE domain/HNH endonuclease
MRTWIFQGNPHQFDIDAYLASFPSHFVWLVTRYADEINLGDRVYIWRTLGAKGTVAGIVAEAEVIGRAEPRHENPDALPYWKSDREARADVAPRADLRLVRLARSREVLKREWFVEDPVLRELPNLRMAAGTNYPVEPQLVDRLGALWNRTGRDWTRNEAVAGLWAYARTYGGQVSRLSGSPVAQVAILLGRAVGGVYNKVMNFRSLDPREARAGMTGAGETDRLVWKEFFDETAGTLREPELDREFSRLWRDAIGQTAPLSDAGEQDALLEVEANKLAAEGLERLLERYCSERETRPNRPNAKTASIRAYERSALVVAIAKLRAEHRCEIPECDHPMFLCTDGTRYMEAHHIVPLSEGGKDVLENIACLCPTHHREIHVGIRRGELAIALQSIRRCEETKVV